MNYSLTIFCLLLVFPTMGQVLFDQDSSGLSLGSQIIFNKESTLAMVVPAFTIKGRVNFGMGAGKEWLNGGEMSARVVRPSFSLLLIRQTEKMPLNILAFTAYQDHSIGSLKLSMRTWEYGLGLVRKVPGRVELFPAITAGLTSSRTKFVNSQGKGSKTSGHFITLDMTLLFNRKIYVAPQLTIDDDSRFFSFLLGILI